MRLAVPSFLPSVLYAAPLCRSSLPRQFVLFAGQNSPPAPGTCARAAETPLMRLNTPWQRKASQSAELAVSLHPHL